MTTPPTKHILLSFVLTSAHHVLSRDAITLLNSTRQIFSSYLRIRSLTSSAVSPELTSARSEVHEALEDLTTDLEDLRLAVSECERDPYRFGLEIQEVAQRRRWLVEIEGEVSDMKEEVTKEASFLGLSSGKGKGTDYTGQDIPEQDDYDAQGNGADDPYSQNEQMYQQEIMRTQDKQLEGVNRTVQNLRLQANDMGRELEEQAVIIEETEAIAERVEGKLKKGVKGIDRFIKKNEGNTSLYLHTPFHHY